MRRLNFKLLLILLASTIGLGVSVYFVHAWQLSSNIDSLFVEAEQAQENGDYINAAKLYQRYLANAPANSPLETKGRCNLAIVADEVARGPKGGTDSIRMAYNLLKNANIADPDHVEVKRRLIGYYLQFTDIPNGLKLADELIRELLKGSPEDVTLHMQLAVTQRGRAHDKEAVKTFARVVGYDTRSSEFKTDKALDPTVLEAYLQLAEVLSSKKFDKKTEARKVIDKMVNVNPTKHKAYEYRARYWRWQIRQDTAAENHDTIRTWIEKDLAKAREIAPKDGELLLASAEFATEQDKHEDAEKFLRQAIGNHQDVFTVYARLADSLLHQKKPDEALAVISSAREKLPNHPQLLRAQATLQLENNEIDKAEATTEKLTTVLDSQPVRGRNAEYLRYYLMLLKARVSLAKGKWAPARRQLERVRPLLSMDKGAVRRIDHYLSICHQRLGEGDKISEGTTQGLLRDINQMAAGGDLDGAIDRLQVIMNTVGRRKFLTDRQYRAVWRELLVRKAANTPANDPGRWRDVDDLVRYLRDVKGYGGVEQVVSEANILYLQGKKSTAGKILLKAVSTDFKKDPNVWVAWINMYQKEKTPEQALQQINAAQKALGDTSMIRILRIANVVARSADNPAAAVDELQKLEAGMDKYSPADRIRVLKVLATAYARLGDSLKTLSLLKQIASASPNDPTVHGDIFNLAMQSEDDEAMDSALEATAKVLGSQSAKYKQMQAARIIDRVRREKEDKARLKEATTLLAEAKKKRPRWDEVARLQGEVAMFERRMNDALVHFEEAVNLGSRNVGVLRRLAALLHAAGRHDDALRKLSLLGESQKAGLTRIEAESYSVTGDTQRALALAKKAVGEGKKNWNDHLWYGQLLQRAKKGAEAEEQFRRAVELKSDEPVLWVTLVNHLAQMEKKKEAAEVVRRAEATLPENIAPQVLAECYERLGEMGAAEEYYKKVYAIDPDSTLSNRLVAQFYLKTNRVTQAQQYLANIMRKATRKDDPNLFWARRMLAQIKSKQGKYRDTLLALRLLDANRLDGKQQVADKRLRAQLLASRPERTSHIEAIGLLEELRADKQLPDNDVFLLARLYRITDDFDAFSSVMQTLPLDKNQAYLTEYVDALMREDRLKQAEVLLRRLETINPGAPAVVALRARILHEHNKTDEALELLKHLVPDTLEVSKLGMIPNVAKLIEEFGHPEEAAVLFRRFEREHPAGVLARAEFHGRQGELDLAFQLLSDAKTKLKTAAIIQTGLGILQARRTKDAKEVIDAKFFQAIESWLAQAEAKQPGSLDLVALRPALRALQGRYDDTMKLYGELLKRDDLKPRQRATFLNNLAFMNAIRGRDLAEARKMINEAIEILGPRSDLLDTRALTLIGHDNDAAIKDLEKAIAEKADAIKFFHKALVHLAANDIRAARAAFAQANEKGFDINTQDPAERDQFNQLVQALKKKPAKVQPAKTKPSAKEAA